MPSAPADVPYGTESSTSVTACVEEGESLSTVRPEGWEESETEDDFLSVDHIAVDEKLPQSEATLWGWCCVRVHAGLDKSKYEWAIVEQELQQLQELEALATDSMAAMQKADYLEKGITLSEALSSQRMTRGDQADIAT